MSKLCTALLLLVSIGVGAQGDYTLHFKSGVQVADDLAKPEDLSPAQLDQAQYSEYYYLLLQFSELPGNGLRQALANRGVTLYTYVPNYAYVARVSVHANLADLPVRAAFLLQPQHKMTTALLEGDYPLYALQGNNLAVYCYLFPGIDPAPIRNRLRDRGYTASLHQQAIAVDLPIMDLEWLAAQPYTMYLEVRPPQPDTEPDGLEARAMQRLNTLSQGPGHGLDGAGVQIAIGDDGAVNHPDINDRLIDLTTTDFGVHAEMTAGILAGSGNLDPQAMGMAPAATIRLLDIDGYPQIFDAVQNLQQHRVVITSTSFGEGCGGVYSVNTRFIDDQVYQHPELFHVFSAGNNATFRCSNRYGKINSPDGLHFANITGGMKAGKNVIAVGNVEINDYLQIRSSRGPAADGRIKPDICAMGQGQYTLSENGSYQFGGGTSAAAPSLAGTAALLYQAYRQKNNGKDPSSALIKALLLNTADDQGRPGPDYAYGWGRVNGARALESLDNKQYLSASIRHGSSAKHNIQVPAGVGQLRVMVYWHDPAGSPLSGQALVNDLDAKLTTPSGKNYLPWRLSTFAHVDSLLRPAWRGVDRFNNVEQITLEAPSPGNYTLQIDGHLIPQGPQDYVVVYSFEPDQLDITYPASGDGLRPEQEVVIRWDAMDLRGGYTLEFSANDGATWQTIAQNIPADQHHWTWTVPDQPTAQARLRLRRGSEMTMSDRFGILGTPQFSVAYHDDAHARMTWQPVPGADIYDVFALQNGFMTQIGTTRELSFLIEQDEAWTSNWYSICARNSQSGVNGQRAVAKNYVHRFCEREITLQFHFDFYPAETTWEIVAEDGTVLTSGGPYAGNLANQELTVTECLPTGCFSFRIFDAFGDGICCSSGDGYYRILDEEGRLLASGGKFNQQESKTICLSGQSQFSVQIQETQSIRCAGGTDGTLSALVNGASGDVRYAWSNGDQTPIVSGLKAGTYSVTVSQGSVSRSETYTLSEPAPLETLLITDDNSCADGSSGRINALVQGGTAPYSLQWSNGESGTRITDLPSGNYGLTVTDDQNCVTQATAVISEPAPISLQLLSQDPECAGQEGGRLEAVVSGGNGPYTVSWSNGRVGPIQENLPAGNYSLTITDNVGCSLVEQIRLREPEPLEVFIQQPESTCEQPTPDLFAQVTGGTAPYTYAWSDGSSSARLRHPARSSYSVTITDQAGCSATATISLSVANVLAMDINTNNPTCYGANNGSAELQIQGGHPPYQVDWGDGSHATARMNLAGGTYSVTVSDAQGCSVSEQIVVREPEPLTLDLAASRLACAQADDGQILTQIMGGAPPYEYQWSDGSEAASRSGLPAGRYSLTVTDQQGCTAVEEVIIEGPAAMSITVSAEAVSCSGADDGRLIASVSGGRAPYTYVWSTGHSSTENELANLAAGMYQLTVTDANGCSQKAEQLVSGPEPLRLGLELTQPGCGQTAGAAQAVVHGGNPPYQISWSHGATGTLANDLSPGGYRVTVTDDHGCQAQKSFDLVPGADLSVEVQLTHPSCAEARDGRLRAVVSGGSGVYTYRWSAGGSLPVRSQLRAGTYQLTVTDVSGCSLVKEVTLTDPDPIELDPLITIPSCPDGHDGRVNMNISGGQKPYQFLWSHGATQQNLEDIPAGTYTFMVVDAAGCSLSRSVNVDSPVPMTLSAEVSDPMCGDRHSGHIDLSVSGGQAPYTFHWSDGADNQQRTALSAGTYHVTISDQAGCFIEEQFDLKATGDLELDFIQLPPTCADAQDGLLQVLPSGGVPPYTATWDHGVTGMELVDISGGTYRLTLTDQAGCIIRDTVTLDPPDPLVLTGTVNPASATTGGSIELNTTGGQPPYQYTWPDGGSASARYNLSLGTYNVTVTDGGGCTAVQSFTIRESSSLYCSHEARSAEYEWIRSIRIGDFFNESGVDQGYGDFTRKIVELEPGKTYPLELKPGYGLRPYYENWYIWIDLNGDRDFTDEGELVAHVREKGDFSGSITIPEVAQSVTTRLRIAMRFLDDPVSCGPYSYGETEDYTVHLNAGEPAYCAARGAVTDFDWIEAVSINGQEITSGPNGGYADFTRQPVPVDEEWLLNLTLGHNRMATDQFWQVWIDFDRDGMFSGSELLLSRRARNSQTTREITMPEELLAGRYRMRVILKWGDEPHPCEEFIWGEVEDYTLLYNQEAEGWIPAVAVPTAPETETHRPPDDIGWRIYPNPARDGFWIEMSRETAWSGPLYIRDLLGRLVWTQEVDLHAGWQKIAVPLHGLPAGSYQVILEETKCPLQVVR